MEMQVNVVLFPYYAFSFWGFDFTSFFLRFSSTGTGGTNTQSSAVITLDVAFVGVTPSATLCVLCHISRDV